MNEDKKGRRRAKKRKVFMKMKERKKGNNDMCTKFIIKLKTKQKNQGVFGKHLPPAATNSKNLFLASRSKSRSQGHSPWCHLKGRH